jgi:hypothetical protein
MKVWIRTRLVGKDEVIIERKRWGWPVGWNASYVPFASLSSTRNKLESEAIGLVEDIKEKCSQISRAEDLLKREVKEAQGSNHGVFGVSPPFEASTDDLKGYKEYHPRPDPAWRGFINPRELSKLGLGKGGSKTKPVSTSSGSGDRTTYTPLAKGELAKYTHEFNADDPDQVLAYEESKNKNNPQGLKAKRKKLRSEWPRNSGESEKDYNLRIEGMLED